MNVPREFREGLSSPEAGIPTEVRAALVAAGLDPARVVVVSEPKPFDPEAPPPGRRPLGAPRHPGRAEGWARAIAVEGVPQHAWRRCHTARWWAWWAPLYAGRNADEAYAYEVGYDRGFDARALRPYPEQVGSAQLVWLKAGYADGEWDRRKGHPRRTSFDPSQKEPS